MANAARIPRNSDRAVGSTLWFRHTRFSATHTFVISVTIPSRLRSSQQRFWRRASGHGRCRLRGHYSHQQRHSSTWNARAYRPCRLLSRWRRSPIGMLYRWCVEIVEYQELFFEPWVQFSSAKIRAFIKLRLYTKEWMDVNDSNLYSGGHLRHLAKTSRGLTYEECCPTFHRKKSKFLGQTVM